MERKSSMRGNDRNTNVLRKNIWKLIIQHNEEQTNAITPAH
jgi:hypothetical protein